MHRQSPNYNSKISPRIDRRFYLGVAVHKIILHMRDSPEIYKPPYKNLKKRLFSKRLAIFSEDERTRIHAIWSYIIELIQLADDFVVEPLFTDQTGNKVSSCDLIIFHRNRVYLIEIKTQSNIASRRKARKQIRSTLNHFKDSASNRDRIFKGYILYFPIPLTLVFEPEWIEVF